MTNAEPESSSRELVLSPIQIKEKLPSTHILTLPMQCRVLKLYTYLPFLPLEEIDGVA